MPELYLSDFDRTLFDTDAYAHDLILAATDLAQLPAQQVDEMVGMLHDSDDTVSIRGLLSEFEIEYDHYIDQVEPNKRDYLHPDGRRLVERIDNLWVVTTAENTALQNKKLTNVGLDQIATVLSGNKGEYIADRLLRTDVGLIFPDFDDNKVFDQITVCDDRFDAVEVLLRISGVRVKLLQRPDTKYPVPADHPDDLIIIESLDEL
jgi:hypothetical protein